VKENGAIEEMVCSRMVGVEELKYLQGKLVKDMGRMREFLFLSESKRH
jgi:hypothetical protein